QRRLPALARLVPARGRTTGQPGRGRQGSGRQGGTRAVATRLRAGAGTGGRRRRRARRRRAVGEPRGPRPDRRGVAPGAVDDGGGAARTPEAAGRSGGGVAAPTVVPGADPVAGLSGIRPSAVRRPPRAVLRPPRTWRRRSPGCGSSRARRVPS